jgi:NADH/NAD ratio-sensing transcriptional regulator Rex
VGFACRRFPDCATRWPENIIAGVLAVPADAAQEVADALVAANVRIIFNYSRAL